MENKDKNILNPFLSDDRMKKHGDMNQPIVSMTHDEIDSFFNNIVFTHEIPIRFLEGFYCDFVK